MGKSSIGLEQPLSTRLARVMAVVRYGGRRVSGFLLTWPSSSICAAVGFHSSKT